jgi:hypothetical protein
MDDITTDASTPSQNYIPGSCDQMTFYIAIGNHIPG